MIFSSTQSPPSSLPENSADEHSKATTSRQSSVSREKTLTTTPADKLQKKPINPYSANGTISNLPHPSQVLKKTPRSFPWLPVLMTIEFFLLR